MPHKKNYFFLLLSITAIVGYCSIIYELILAQCLAIALGNTIVRYSVTIGLYLFSLGMGSLYLYFFPAKNSLKTLIIAEVLLALLGIFLPVLIVGSDHVLFKYMGQDSSLLSPQLCSWIFIHTIVVLIGFLSGVEVPLLMEMVKVTEPLHQDKAETLVLATDYLATFIGAVSFPFFIYQKLGLLAGSAFASLLNTGAILLLAIAFVPWRRSYGLLLFSTLAIAIAFSVMIHEGYLRQQLITYLFAKS